MNVWAEESKPEVICTRTVLMAMAIHCAAFIVFWLFAKFSFRPKETVIPIDLMVVVNENLDGEENEPPPLDNPEEEKPQPKPKPQPVPKEDPAPPVKDAVIREKPKEKKKPEKKKPEEKKKDEPKKDDPPKKEEPKVDPKKLKEEKEKARKKRLEEMRKKSTAVKPVKIVVKNQPSGNGRTERQTMTQSEIEKALGGGARAGTRNQLTADETQRCVSLIKRAFYEQWETPAWNAMLRDVRLRVRFDKNGVVVKYDLEQSSGDRKVDATVIAAAAKVHRVYGLSTTFLESERFTVTINFNVKNR